MSELTDDQLDGLFRKSAEEFDPPLDSAAWQDMEARLDAHDRTTTGGTPLWNKVLRWGLPIVLLLLLTGGAWYAYTKGRFTVTDKAIAGGMPDTEKAVVQNESQPTQSARLSARKTQTPTDAGLPVAESDKEKQPANLPDLSATVNEPEKTGGKPPGAPDATAKGRFNSMAATKRPATAYRPTYGPDRTKPSRTASTLVEKSRPETVRQRSGRGGRREDRLLNQNQKSRKLVSRRALLTSSSTTPATPSESSFGKRRTNPPVRRYGGANPRRETTDEQRLLATDLTASTNTTLLDPEEADQSKLNLSTINDLAIRPGQWPGPLPFRGRDVVVQPDTVAQRVIPKPAAMRGLSVRFIVSPDLSSIGLKNFSRPGTNIGLLLEYRLASRWSVQAGVIQSTKVYRASTAEYVLPYNVAKQSKLPESVNGQCNMLDIPVNIRYDVMLRPRPDGRPPSRWFVSGGLTSYIIRQEDYVYNYSGYVHDPVREWNGSTGAFGFSQLNLSAGYERAISRRLSWQVEPFLKAPLRGIGYLKINLLSTGAFFSLRYKL